MKKTVVAGLVAMLAAAALAAASQCMGVTKKGEPCKNKTTNANGYCHVHQSQAK